MVMMGSDKQKGVIVIVRFGHTAVDGTDDLLKVGPDDDGLLISLKNSRLLQDVKNMVEEMGRDEDVYLP